MYVRSLACCADSVVSLCTACMFYGAPTASAGPVRGTHAVGHHHAGEPLSNCKRTLLGFQIFVWNVACIGSLVVVTVFWTVLVRTKRGRLVAFA